MARLVFIALLLPCFAGAQNIDIFSIGEEFLQEKLVENKVLKFMETDTDQDRIVRHIRFDDQGRRIEQLNMAFDEDIKDHFPRSAETWTYNSAGQLITHGYQVGRKQEGKYTLEPDGLDQYTYEQGQLVRFQPKVNANGKHLVVSYKYKDDKLLEETAFGHEYKVLTSYQYDEAGREIKAQKNGEIRGFGVHSIQEKEYDENGRLSKLKLLFSGVWEHLEYTYNDRGQKMAGTLYIITSEGRPNAICKLKYRYDAQQRFLGYDIHDAENELLYRLTYTYEGENALPTSQKEEMLQKGGIAESNHAFSYEFSE